MSSDLLIRAPNHLGDLVLALPALEAAASADVLVAGGLAPLLALAPGFGPGAGGRRRILPLERGARGFWRAVGRVRAGGYRRGVLLTPSFSSALIFAAGGVAERRGTATDGRRLLLSDAVAPESLAGLHRGEAYYLLSSGARPERPLAPRLEVPEEARARWRVFAGPTHGEPVIGIFPGSNATSRRWDAERFASLVRTLRAQGVRVVVFGGPQERTLAAAVAGGDALDVAGRTDLPLLAAGLAGCDLLVTNDSGPMHLAAAVGTPTVSLWGAGDPAVTGPLGAGHRLLRRAELPCVPCVRNECPRRGTGFVLPEAERECLRLIEVADVAGAVASCATRAATD